MLWSHDPDSSYFHHPTRRFLIYDNKVQSSSSSSSTSKQSIPASLQYVTPTEFQLLQLRTALAFGHLLNRTVVLPRFSCGPAMHDRDAMSLVDPDDGLASFGRRQWSDNCPLQALVDIAAFDTEFSGRYRESSFGRNRLVPFDIRQALSGARRVTSCESTAELGGVAGGPVALHFESLFAGSKTTLTSACRPMFENNDVKRRFEEKIRRGFLRNDYRQTVVRAQPYFYS